MIGRAASAEENTSVRGLGHVLDGEAARVDAFAISPADLSPIGRGQRLGQRHQGIYRNQLPVQFPQSREIRFAAKHDRLRPDIATRGVQGRSSADGEVGHLRLLVDRRSAPLDRTREPAHEPARMNIRCILVVDRP